MLGRRASLRSTHADRRRTCRIPVRITAAVCSTSIAKRRVAMTDISATGCRVETPFGWPAGSVVVVTIPTLAPRAARVLWRTPGAVGLAFDQALNPLVLEGPLSSFRPHS